MRYVLYHANCYDGFGAAYAAWKKFGYDNTKYIPVGYGYPPPDMPDATEIYVVDFSYPGDDLLKMSESAKVFVLDHHKTAQENLKPLQEYVAITDNKNLYIEFDMKRSGALISWEHFHSDSSGAVPINRLIEHISDRDLWTYNMNGSREVHAALVSLPFDFEVWDKLIVDDLIIEGRACLRFQTQLVNNIIKKSWLTKMDEYEIPVVNTSSSWSEVGEAMLLKYKDAPFVASFTEFEKITMWSLRSVGDFDVSAVAKKHGGGGHKNAAGFTVNK